MPDHNEHQRLVRGLIDHFNSQGLKIISAAFGDLAECQKIGSHIPDVIAYHMDQDIYHIGKAKTCDELESEKTREEFEDFANAVVDKIGKERTFLPFCIAVPKNCISRLDRCLKEIGLSLNGNIQPLAL